MGCRQASSIPAVDVRELLIEREKIPQDAEAQQAAGQHIQQAREPLAHVEPVDAQPAEEGQQDPGQVVVMGAGDEAPVGIVATCPGISSRSMIQPMKKQPQGERTR